RDLSRRPRVELRAPALSALVTYMLDAWPSHAALDPGRVGAFGFSAGGFTVLVAVGGRPDLSRLAPQCARHPARYDCAVSLAHPGATAASWPPERDGRIRAAVIAAPGLGYLFDRASLAAVTVPVQLWRADRDRVVSGPYSVDVVRAALPTPPEFHPVPGAGHLDFMAPCDAAAVRSRWCTTAPGFDPAAFHRDFDAAILRFFRTTLAPPA
ncbi:MAG: dienelactone hydrolase, partial [Gluconacetobacter diazotrophicus]|nr:dienelactone hydrolase [Gluconacetobacter diazotrophicus]